VLKVYVGAGVNGDAANNTIKTLNPFANGIYLLFK
jgi:hypothetical protein